MYTEKQYSNGFNNGYQLSKYEPDLLSKLIKNIQPSAGYLEGFFSGKEEYEIEKAKEKLDDLDRLRKTPKERGQELGREL